MAYTTQNMCRQNMTLWPLSRLVPMMIPIIDNRVGNLHSSQLMCSSTPIVYHYKGMGISLTLVSSTPLVKPSTWSSKLARVSIMLRSYNSSSTPATTTYPTGAICGSRHQRRSYWSYWYDICM